MKKRGAVTVKIIFIAIFSIVQNIMLMSSAFAVVLFSENFGTGTDFTNNIPGWGKSSLTTSGSDDQFSITSPPDGTYYAWVANNTNDQYINKTGISTAGFQNIKISYYYNLIGGFSDSDFLIAEWKLSSGNTWNTIQKTTGLPGWNQGMFDLPGAENTLIDIKVREDEIDKGEFVLIDNITITGASITNCGNNLVGPDEQCDDGNQNNDDTCSNCELTYCGDNILQQPNGFGTAGPQNDGIEACDDGNLNNNDQCSNNCELPQPVCGNGALESGEECDDGNLEDNDGCDSSCNVEEVPFCGDGIVNLFEECDDADFNNHDECLNSCEFPSCGDGFLWTGVEQCDDGDQLSGDGCDSQCNFEPSEQCLAPVDIMLVIDKSGSMVSPDPQRLQDAKSAAITFVNTVNFSKDTVGLASFNQIAVLDQELTSTQADITNAINALAASGQTNIGDGVKVGRIELVANGGATKAMILLSDGAPNVMSQPNGSLRFCFVNPTSPTNCTIYALNQSNITKQAGIEIFTIGLGVNNFTEGLLKEMASAPSNYFSAPNSSELESIYLQIAGEICPCSGFDCSINSDQCNVGSCNLESDQCEFIPKQESTSCEEDGNLCTINHCDGEGACVPLDEVDCSEINGQCSQGACNPDTGLCDSDPLPESTPCEADDNLCTIEHCDGSGSCVEKSTKDCSFLNTNCQQGACNPENGECEIDFFELSTSCEADGNLCTLDHCNGFGSCVEKSTKDCSFLNTNCQQGACNSENGECEPSFADFPISTSCNADNDLCTLDHCDGGGSCLNFGNVPVPPSLECKSFFCDPADGEIKTDFLDISTFCVTDDSECTIQHCDGQGNCVNNPDAELPEECISNITKDAKASQGQPTLNFGSGRYMIVNPKTGNADRNYIGVDVSASLGDVLSSANLKLAVYYTGGNATGSAIQAFYCKDHDFVETSINWNNQPIDNECSLADTLIVPGEVIAGAPETIHVFDFLNETNYELANDDGLFTIVLKSAEENSGINHNKKYVQYLTKEYPDADFRPKFETS